MKNSEKSSSKTDSRTVLEEYELAKKEPRQPLCVYCGKPLEISQNLYNYIDWRWDPKTKSYRKIDDMGDADAPYCVKCLMEDWGFVDDKHVFY